RARRRQAHRAPVQDAGVRARRVPRNSGGGAEPSADDGHLLDPSRPGRVLLLVAVRQDGSLPVGAQSRGFGGGVRAGRRPHARAGLARVQGHRGEAPRHSISPHASTPRRARRRAESGASRRSRVMCGIAGVVALADRASAPDLVALRALAGALRHRGPDELGLYRDRRAGLAHARLAIIDLATGQQPLANEDESIWVVYNGEIFNYIELRAELEALGHRFRTRSDTEVIVHAWEEWGERSFERYNGQFALALWDAKRSALVLARDRLGVRPLYYAEHEGRVWFAS